MPTPEQDDARFLAKVIRKGADECWPWDAAVDGKGYGAFQMRGKLVRAHRYAYERFVGPIPEGYDIDHDCHDPEECQSVEDCPHRACVNWERHLVPRTRKDNLRRGGGPSGKHARKTHCNAGHEFTPENTKIESNGSRRCKECRRKRDNQRGSGKKRERYMEQKRAQGRLPC